ncbi:MAG: beta-lactamase family protein [Chloroflexi bacterium]|nr:beta-lactamase family protein [Chloroflexota bacterium]
MAELDAMFTELVAEENIPGMAVAIVAQGEVVWSEGYGFANIQSQQPVTPDTPFLIASVSKLFTGVGVMKAWEQGHLVLDANINDYLSFPVDNPHLNDEVITLRHLATHTSGIIDNLSAYGSTYVAGDPETTLTQYLEAYLSPQGELYDAKANFADSLPGESWAYSNVGSALAGELVEASTGIPLDNYTQEQIFTPLGMENSGWHLSDFENQADIAVPYNFGVWPWVYGAEVSYGISYNNDDENSLFGRHGLEQYGSPSYPDGGLRSSVNDAARFLAAMMSGGEFDGVRILDEATITTMFEPQFGPLEKDFETDEQALFWVYDDGLLGHSGGDPGTLSILFFDPETKVGGVILMNRGADLMAVAVRQRVLHQIMDNRNQINELLANE